MDPVRYMIGKYDVHDEKFLLWFKLNYDETQQVINYCQQITRHM